MTHVNTPNSLCRFAVIHGDVTPPVGMYHRMWGAAVHDRSEGVHRPLRSTVAIFRPRADSQAGEQIVFVALDHCLLGKPEMDLVLNSLQAATQVPREQFLLVFSHTHGAGLMSLDRQSLPGGDGIPDYLDRMATSIAEQYKAAAAQVQNATITYGVARCDLAAHRDFWDEASGQFVCGFNPHQPADDTVQVARITGDDGQVLATVVNYACHPTTLAWDNRLVSPDFPGAMREVIERETAAPCIFVQGASGEIGPKEGFMGDVAVAERNGRQLGFAALSTLTSLSPPATRYEYMGPVVSGATIGTWRHVPVSAEGRDVFAIWKVKRWIVPLKYRAGLPTVQQAKSDRVKWEQDEASALAAGDTVQARNCRAMVERQTRLLGRLAALPPGDHYPLEVVLHRMGDAIWLTLPGEHYNLFQRELRRRFPRTPIVVATLGNGWGPSYLPTADIYGRGIYQETIALLAPGCLEQLIEAIAKELGELLQ